MTLRTSLRRLTRRDPAAPSLRERAADLKAGLARAAGHPSAQEADAGRRAVMGGVLAAAMPLPALGASAAAGDAELLALVAPFRATLRTARDAETAASAALEVYRATRPERPAALYCDATNGWPLVTVREEDAGGWIPDATGSYANPRYVVTTATLREDIEESAPRSKACRLAKAKLPIAEAYEAAETAARERSGVTAALAARDDARKSLERAAAEALTMKASTAQGVAFQAAILGAVERPGSNMGVYLFALHGQGLPASITAALGNPLLAD